MDRPAWIAGCRRAGFAAMAIAIATTLRVAAAQAPAAFPLELEWNAPAACGSAEQVRAELERIARVRPGLRLTPLAARANVERHGAAFSLALFTEHDGERGERTLEAADCETLVRSVTLVLALAFGAGVEVADETASPAGAGSTTTAGAAGATQEPAEQHAAANTESGAADDASKQHDADRARTAKASDGDDQSDNGDSSDDRDSTADDTRSEAARWALLIGGGAQFSLMPSAAFAATAGAELDLGSFAIGLRTSAWPGVSKDLASGLSARFDGIAGQLQGCSHLPFAAFTFALCADARAAALRGRSDGALVDRSATAPWYALGATTALTWPRNYWLSARIEASLAASLNRPRFVLENFDEVQRVPQLLPSVGALLVVTP